MSDTPTAEQLVRDELAKVGSVFDGYVRGRDAERQALLDQIAELEAGGGDTTRGTLFGASNLGSLPAGITAVAGRAYVASGKRPTSWTQLPADQRATVERTTQCLTLSWKEPPGDWLSALLDSLRRDRPEMVVIGCQNHEPYDNFTTAAQIAEYHKRWDAAVPLMHDHAVIPSTILDGSHPESWDVFARDDVVYQGMDRYNPGIGTPKSYQAPSDVFGPYLDWLASIDHDFSGLIAETGTGRTAADTRGTGQLSWAMAAREYLRNRVDVALWWSQDELVLTQPLAQAWLLGQSV